MTVDAHGRGPALARSLVVGVGLLFAVGALPGCTPKIQISRAQSSVEAGDLESARTTLEQARRRNPSSIDVRIALGEVYYRIARDALDREQNETRYLAFLERAVDEFVRAVELDPRHDRPHFFLAVVDAYRGDLDGAMRGFQNTRRLNPIGVTYTNIAEIYVYLGDLPRARVWNRRGLRRGAGVGPVTFNEMLIKWSAGDLRGARRQFARLRAEHPEMIRTINEAPVPIEPRRFEQFAEYCCESPACGPYLEDACRDLGLEVQHRDLSDEAVLKELRIEMEKQRRLRKIYEQRKELELEIEGTEPAP